MVGIQNRTINNANPVEGAFEIAALLGAQPLGVAWAVGHHEQRDDAQDYGGQPLDNEEPLPTLPAEPVHIKQ